MDILHRDDLQRGGFAGLREYRLVTDRRIFGEHVSKHAWDGLGNFVYLADAKFLPYGETHMHQHKEIDVISVMLEGRIQHEGSLQHGQQIQAPNVQVQRAGSEGFSHNEINPDAHENRMIQIWVLPEQSGQAADYKTYSPVAAGLTRVYGGNHKQKSSFASQTLIDIAMLNNGQSLALTGDFMAYITHGRGYMNGCLLADGDLVRGSALQFDAKDDTHIIIIR